MRSFTMLTLVSLACLGWGCSSESPAPPPEATDEATALPRIVWVDRAGVVTGNVGEPQQALSGLEVAPDGARVVARARENGSDDIFIHEGDTTTRLTHDEAHARHPQWSPTGERIAYFSYRNGAADIFVRAADGSGDDTPITTGPMHEYYPDWSPDEQFILFHLHDTDTDGRDLWYVPVAGDGPPTPLIETPYDVGLARFSPDGNNVAYQARDGESWNVFVVDFPSGENIRQVSIDGGVWPKWSAEGDELFYFDDDTLMRVSVALGPEIAFGAPEALFDTGAVGGWSAPEASLFNPLYGPAPDGSRFAIVLR